MKKVILLFMTGAAYYIASMYRQMPLMVLAIAMIMLDIILFVLPRYLMQGIQLSFPKQMQHTEKGKTECYDIIVENRGKLPVRYITARLQLYDEKGTLIKKYKVRKDDREMTDIISLSADISHCGLYRLSISQVRVYDYLQAFSSAKSVQQQMNILVLPKVKAMKFKFPYMELQGRQSEDANREQMRYSGTENRDIRQIREYQNGDTMRHIHWNLSARADKMWMKEYERENDSFFRLLLDIRPPEAWKAEEKDGFYELISAFILGFLQSDWGLLICWYDSETGGFVSMKVEQAAQYRNMMAKLYKTEFIADEKADSAYARQQAVFGNNFIRLNLGLECYYGEKFRYRFTYENLEQELSQAYLFSLC
ncbi:MAG: DUF58 domain-containing protein [Lachnospiraceae bacterium]|nr:DUF58 domain-containing protein [Lachnospiraceae bacterium]